MNKVGKKITTFALCGVVAAAACPMQIGFAETMSVTKDKVWKRGDVIVVETLDEAKICEEKIMKNLTWDVTIELKSPVLRDWKLPREVLKKFKGEFNIRHICENGSCEVCKENPENTWQALQQKEQAERQQGHKIVPAFWCPWTLRFTSNLYQTAEGGVIQSRVVPWEDELYFAPDVKENWLAFDILPVIKEEIKQDIEKNGIPKLSGLGLLPPAATQVALAWLSGQKPAPEMLAALSSQAQKYVARRITNRLAFALVCKEKEQRRQQECRDKGTCSSPEQCLCEPSLSRRDEKHLLEAVEEALRTPDNIFDTSIPEKTIGHEHGL
ncbi:hypothetical protein FACS189481_5270 [Clostridia bacterium]|nr:hypothetical protein FACS189481_5270 [Clostridia bacterium]